MRGMVQTANDGEPKVHTATTFESRMFVEEKEKQRKKREEENKQRQKKVGELSNMERAAATFATDALGKQAFHVMPRPP